MKIERQKVKKYLTDASPIPIETDPWIDTHRPLETNWQLSSSFESSVSLYSWQEAIFVDQEKVN